MIAGFRLRLGESVTRVHAFWGVHMPFIRNVLSRRYIIELKIADIRDEAGLSRRGTQRGSKKERALKVPACGHSADGQEAQHSFDGGFGAIVV